MEEELRELRYFRLTANHRFLTTLKAWPKWLEQDLTWTLQSSFETLLKLLPSPPPYTLQCGPPLG